MTLAAGTEQIDAHLHLWDLEVCSYPWLGPQHGPLHATFTPDQARAELDAHGLSGAVVVQAEDSTAETDYLLSLAREHEWLLGVVGWLPLEDPAATTRTLERWAAARRPGRGRLVGVRHLVHDDPRDDFLALPGVRESLALAAEAGLTLDVPDAWPRHLRRTGDLARALPQLRIVVDHLAKPPRGTTELPAWRAELARVAAEPNTVAKLSGLHVPGVPFSASALRGVWEAALELFGPARLMYGGDWPMTVPLGGYGPSHEVLTTLVAELSAVEQQQIMAGTARAVYGLSGGAR